MDDRLSTLTELGRRARAASDEIATPGATIEAARRRALGTFSARPAPRRRLQVALAAAAALALALALLIPRRPALTYVVGAEGAPGQLGGWIAAGAEATPVRFSEGTVLLLASSARARVTHVDADGASVLLERGSARATVVHAGPSTSWSVNAGPFAIAVVGTAFDVAWDPEREVLDLSMIEGRVLVSGPLLGGRRALAAGERLRVDVQAQRSEVGALAALPDERFAAAPPAPPAPPAPLEPPAPPAADAPATPGGAAPAVAAPAQPAPKPAPEPAPEWRALSAAGRHREAMEAIEREGFARVLDATPAPGLIELADVARHAGQHQRAREALVRARSLGARGRSAFLLGKMAADHGGAPAEAISWFEAYLREEPGGGFAEQALGRLIELRRRSGDAAGARRAAEEYLRRYPGGAYASLAELAVAP